MKRLLVQCICFYQMWFSPDHSHFSYRHPFGFCRFYPTCSEYAKISIQKHGAIKGVLKACFRIIRCNPFSEGGLDKA